MFEQVEHNLILILGVVLLLSAFTEVVVLYRKTKGMETRQRILMFALSNAGFLTLIAVTFNILTLLDTDHVQGWTTLSYVLMLLLIMYAPFVAFKQIPRLWKQS